MAGGHEDFVGEEKVADARLCRTETDSKQKANQISSFSQALSEAVKAAPPPPPTYSVIPIGVQLDGFQQVLQDLLRCS